MMTVVVYVCILAFFVAEFLLSRILAVLNASYYNKPIPALLSDVYDAKTYAKQQEYANTNYKFSWVVACVNFLICGAALVFGWFGWLDGQLRMYITQPILLSLVFFGILLVLNNLMDLPENYYSTFVIESRFGFNKRTKKLFWRDELRSLAMAVVLGGAILALLCWIYSLTPSYFWLWAWIAISAFSLFMLLFYSQLIVPLFNKQTPLAEGELRTAIEQFAQKAGFVINNIYVMDGSKRSTKANAYFTGFGPKKRIVLYDTLMQQLSTEEIVAVLAHEIGHYQKKHTLLRLIVSMVLNLIKFALLGFCLQSPALSMAMGGTQTCFHLGVLAFALLYTPLSVVLDLGLNVLSRHHEYQADAFAASFGMSQALISALKKISGHALANMQPHPAYVFVHHSHPTLLQRVEALLK